MTNRFLISTAIAALIAGTGFANAQGNPPAAGSTVQQTAPSTERAAPSAPMSRDSASDSKGIEKGVKSTQTDEKLAPKGGKNLTAQDGAKGDAKGEKSKSMSSETDTKGAKDMKAEGKSGAMDSKSASDSKAATDSKSGNMNAQTKSPADTTKSQATDTTTKSPATTTQSQTTQSPAGAKSQTTTGNAATSATAAPPPEKQTQIVSAIKTEKIQETTNVNFNISVGAMVPATVRFHPLPPRIVEIYPEWRGYEVVLVHGRYVIVRPTTHEIVYIIEG